MHQHVQCAHDYYVISLWSYSMHMYVIHSSPCMVVLFNYCVVSELELRGVAGLCSVHNFYYVGVPTYLRLSVVTYMYR